MVTVLPHARQRIQERLTEAGLEESKQVAMLTIADYFARKAKKEESLAVKVYDFDHQVGNKLGLASNGDEVWMIIRSKQVHTVMFRRKTQPKTPEALNVDRILVLN